MGYLEIAYDENNHVKITETGLDVLYGRKQALLSRVDHSQQEKARKPRKRLTLEIPSITIPGMAATVGTEDPKLFEALRQLRLTCAQEEGFPPYIVFSDKVLHMLATQKPTTIEQFGLIPGVGNHKQQKYGRRFIEVIKRYG